MPDKPAPTINTSKCSADVPVDKVGHRGAYGYRGAPAAQVNQRLARLLPVRFELKTVR